MSRKEVNELAATIAEYLGYKTAFNELVKALHDDTAADALQWIAKNYELDDEGVDE